MYNNNQGIPISINNNSTLIILKPLDFSNNNIKIFIKKINLVNSVKSTMAQQISIQKDGNLVADLKKMKLVDQQNKYFLNMMQMAVELWIVLLYNLTLK